MSQFYRLNTKRLLRIIERCYDLAENIKHFDPQQQQAWLQEAQTLQTYLIPCLNFKIDPDNLTLLEEIDGQLSLTYRYFKNKPSVIHKHYQRSQKQLARLTESLASLPTVPSITVTKVEEARSAMVEQLLLFERETIAFDPNNLDDFPEQRIDGTFLLSVPRANIPSYALPEKEIVIPQIIVGNDDREPINSFSVPFRMICCLELNTNKGLRIGTGCLVGKKTVLTAAHNLIDKENGNIRTTSSVFISPGRSGDQTFNNLSASSSEFYIPPGWQNGNNFNPDFDYALIFLDSDLGSSTETFAFGNFPDAELKTFNLALAGYPVDRDNGTTQVFAQGKITEVKGNRLLHEIDTNPGQSGAPLWGQFPSNKSPGQLVRAVVAIHTSSFSQKNTNSATRLSAEIAKDINNRIKD